jgi:hypothetical protein
MCADCCGNAYSSGSTTYGQRLDSNTTINCACNACASTCSSDNYCIGDASQGFTTQACLDCVRSSIEQGAACAISCTGSCASFQTCFDGCP